MNVSEWIIAAVLSLAGMGVIGLSIAHAMPENNDILYDEYNDVEEEGEEWMEENRGCCLFRAFKGLCTLIGFIVIAMIVISVVEIDKSKTEQTTQNKTQSAYSSYATNIPSSTKEPLPTKAPHKSQGLPGSSVYDILDSLVKIGVKLPSSHLTSDGLTWEIKIDTPSTYSTCYIIADNNDLTIKYCYFARSGSDNGFVKNFGSSLIYDTMDADAARQLVNGKMSAEKVIGDAVFYYSIDEYGEMLQIANKQYRNLISKDDDE